MALQCQNFDFSMRTIRTIEAIFKKYFSPLVPALGPRTSHFSLPQSCFEQSQIRKNILNFFFFNKLMITFGDYFGSLISFPKKVNIINFVSTKWNSAKSFFYSAKSWSCGHVSATQVVCYTVWMRQGRKAETGRPNK